MTIIAIVFGNILMWVGFLADKEVAGVAGLIIAWMGILKD